MTWREIIREAWRNLAAGVTHAARWALVAAIALGGLAWLETDTIRRLANDAAAYISGGGATWVLQAGRAIDGQACEALGQVDGVAGAGALRSERTPLTLFALPNAPIPAYSATPGLLALLGATSPSGSAVAAGVALSETAADVAGMTGPGSVDLASGPVDVAAVYPWPDDGRRGGLSYAAVMVAPASETFDECWVTVWPGDQATINLVRTAVATPSGEAASARLGQLNPSFASDFAAATAFWDRPTRWLALASLMVGLAVGFTAVWSRRLELASALHCGVGHVQMVAQISLETLAWSVGAIILASPAVLLTGISAAQDSIHIVGLGVRCLVLGWVGCLAAAAGAATAVREKQLFDLFRTR